MIKLYRDLCSLTSFYFGLKFHLSKVLSLNLSPNSHSSIKTCNTHLFFLLFGLSSTLNSVFGNPVHKLSVVTFALKAVEVWVPQLCNVSAHFQSQENKRLTSQSKLKLRWKRRNNIVKICDDKDQISKHYHGHNFLCLSQPRSQGFSNFKGKSPGNEVVSELKEILMSLGSLVKNRVTKYVTGYFYLCTNDHSLFFFTARHAPRNRMLKTPHVCIEC